MGAMPKMAKVVIEATDADGNTARFTYLAQFPDAPPDPSAGLELAVEHRSDVEQNYLDPLTPARQRTISHGATWSIEGVRTYTLETVSAAPPDAAAELAEAADA